MSSKGGKVLAIIIVTSFLVYFYSFNHKRPVVAVVQDAYEMEIDGGIVQNLSSASFPPRKDGGNVFFLETRVSPNQAVNLTRRQACAIESAAIANPELDIFVLFAYDVKFISESSTAITNAISSYTNVHLYEFDPVEYAKNTIIEKWMKEGKVFHSSHLIHHLSDVLRILTLWKYSGTYFDLDVIEKKPISERGHNFACIQNDGMIVSGIVDLHGYLGRLIAEKNLKEVTKHFDGSSWTGNGPMILSNIIKKMCNTTDIHQMNRKNCNGFEVLPTKDCYAIDYPQWQKFFDPNYLNETSRATEDSFIVHFWNYLSGGRKLKTNSDAFYVEMAKEYCPRVFSASGDEF